MASAYVWPKGFADSITSFSVHLFGLFLHTCEAWRRSFFKTGLVFSGSQLSLRPGSQLGKTIFLMITVICMAPLVSVLAEHLGSFHFWPPDGRARSRYDSWFSLQKVYVADCRWLSLRKSCIFGTLWILHSSLYLLILGFIYDYVCT